MSGGPWAGPAPAAAHSLAPSAFGCPGPVRTSARSSPSRAERGVWKSVLTAVRVCGRRLGYSLKEGTVKADPRVDPSSLRMDQDSARSLAVPLMSFHPRIHRGGRGVNPTPAWPPLGQHVAHGAEQPSPAASPHVSIILEP